MTTHTSERQGLAIREQFEQWAGPQGLRLNVRDLAPRDSDRFGQYCADDTQLAFEAFRAAALSRGEGRAVEPIGWVYQHDETGRMSFCPNDGINTPDVYMRLNPRHILCGPAYSHPAQDNAAIEALGAGGEGLGGYDEARHWIERYAAGVDDELQMDMVVKALSGGREEVYGDDKLRKAADMSILDRVEFALRDAGMDYDEASKYAYLSEYGIDPRTTPQPTAAQPVAWDDEAAWALVQRAEEAGAERDSDDNGTWWTLRIAQFNALAATNTHAQEQVAGRVTDEAWLKAMLHEGVPASVAKNVVLLVSEQAQG